MLARGGAMSDVGKTPAALLNELAGLDPDTKARRPIK
jgi:hypothetical protein